MATTPKSVVYERLISLDSEQDLNDLVHLAGLLKGFRVDPPKRHVRLWLETVVVFVAREEATRRIVGTTSLSVLPGLTGITNGRVDDVVVRRDFQRQGVGRSLLQCAETEARARGILELRLYSRPHSRNAHTLYRSLGWVESTWTTSFSKKI
jgi:GNAT superfamily N-acetyltransferase